MARDPHRDPQPALRPLEAITILAVIGMLALALGVVALARPATTVENRKVAFSQSGTFAYSAKAPKDSVYGVEGLTTGRPILLGVVGPVQATFTYTLTTDAPADLRGTAALALTVDPGNGLIRTFTVASPRQFSGTTVTVDGVLPLQQIRDFVDTAGRTVGNLQFGGATVTLAPQIAVDGTLDGRPLEHTTYAPGLTFTLNGATLLPAGGGANSTTGATSGPDPLHPVAKGSLPYSVVAPNTMPLVLVHPPVTATRIVGFAVAALCLVLCLWVARSLRAGGSVGDRARIEGLYGGQLVRVTEIGRHTGPVADVSSMEALVGLAKKYESMIMQMTEPDVDTYLVWDNGIMFRYRIDHLPSDTENPSGESDREDDDSTRAAPPHDESDTAVVLGDGRWQDRDAV